MKAKDILTHYNITRNTLANWVKAGKIPFTVLPSGHYNYHNPSTITEQIAEQITHEPITVLYCRCSTTAQKENLARQIDRLKIYATSKGHVVNHVYSEIASALNYNRRMYRKLYNDVITGNVNRIIVEYKDRLLRIGFDDFQFLCDAHNVELVVIDKSADQSKNQEITTDLISIIHHFSAKIYSARKRKKILDTVNDND